MSICNPGHWGESRFEQDFIDLKDRRILATQALEASHALADMGE